MVPTTPPRLSRQTSCPLDSHDAYFPPPLYFFHPSRLCENVIRDVLIFYSWLPTRFALASRKPYRHTLQLMVSMGQLYGDILYFGTCYLEGFIHSAPGILYFWFYFVAMNAIWVIIPALIIVRTFLLSLEAVKVADKHKKQL